MFSEKQFQLFIMQYSTKVVETMKWQYNEILKKLFPITVIAFKNFIFNSSRWGFTFLPPAQNGEKKAAD